MSQLLGEVARIILFRFFLGSCPADAESDADGIQEEDESRLGGLLSQRASQTRGGAVRIRSKAVQPTAQGFEPEAFWLRQNLHHLNFGRLNKFARPRNTECWWPEFDFPNSRKLLPKRQSTLWFVTSTLLTSKNYINKNESMVQPCCGM